MARFNFDTYEQTHQSSGGNGQGDFKVKFFKVANGETKVVRFPYKSATEFDTVDVHTIQEGSRFRKISCLRNAYEPIEKCPLCAANKPVKSRFLAKVLYYEQDPTTGAMLPKAGVWDAPISVAKQLKGFIQEYNDISTMIFKLSRTGDKLETSYQIIPANTAVYRDEIYPLNYADFEGLKMENRFYFDKTADEMNIYLTTGQFPQVQKTQAQNTGFVAQTPVQQVPVNQTFTPQAMNNPNYIDESVQAGAQAFQQYVPPKMGVDNNTAGYAQPVPQQMVSPEPQFVQPQMVQTTPATTTAPATGRRYSY